VTAGHASDAIIPTDDKTAPIAFLEIANRLFAFDAWAKPKSYFDVRDAVAYVRAVAHGMRRLGADLIGVTKLRYESGTRAAEFLRRAGEILGADEDVLEEVFG
jgi:hypothetical protein